MDSLLGGLFGGSGDQNQGQGGQLDPQDFISRYEQGPPYDNISTTEALSAFQSVAGRLSPQEMEQAATESFQRLSPAERQEFARMVQERSGGQIAPQSDSPDQLAHLFTQLTSGGGGGGLGGMLGGLLGGSGGGGLGGLLGGGGSGGAGSGGGIGDLIGGVLGGDESQSRTQGGQGGQGGGGMGDLLQSPVVKAVLAGVAAMAMRRFGQG